MQDVSSQYQYVRCMKANKHRNRSATAPNEVFNTRNAETWLGGIDPHSILGFIEREKNEKKWDACSAKRFGLFI